MKQTMKTIAITIVAIVTAWGGGIFTPSRPRQYPTGEGRTPMTEAITLADVLKTAPTAPFRSDLQMLVVDSTGNIKKMATDCILPYKILPENTDLNTITTTGMYLLKGGDLNRPSTSNTAGAIMLVIWRASGYVSQIIFPALWTVGMYYRSIDANTWKPWKRIEGTTMTS